jgi:hypothetical protein
VNAARRRLPIPQAIDIGSITDFRDVLGTGHASGRLKV